MPGPHETGATYREKALPMIDQKNNRDEDAVAEFLAYASDDQLATMVGDMKDAAARVADDQLRERVLSDVERIQDELDRRNSEGTGRHRLVYADDRPTTTLPRLDDTAPMSSISGTLDLPAVPSDVPDQESAERLLAAIRGTASDPDVDELDEDEFGLYADEPSTEEGWYALEADLGEESGWLARKLRPHRVAVLSVVVAVVVTWGVAWAVMGR